jgi:hypothetical protein
MSEHNGIFYPDYYLQMDSSNASHAAREFMRDTGKVMVFAYHPQDRSRFPCLEVMDKDKIQFNFTGFKAIVGEFPGTPVRPEVAEFAKKPTLISIQPNRLVEAGG